MKPHKTAVILFLALFASCGPARVIPYQKDSTIVRIKDSVVFRDSVILVPVEKEEHSAVLPDPDTSRLATRYAESEAFVSGGRLHHTLRNRSEALIPVEVKLPKYIHTEKDHSIQTIVERIEVEKQLSRWQQFMQALGYVFLGGAALWLGIRIRRIIA